MSGSGGLAWTADGRNLVLSGNQGGARRLWTLPVTGGGLEPLAIASEMRDLPIDLVTRRPDDVHSRFSFTIGTCGGCRWMLVSRAARLFRARRASNGIPAFSPDGRKLAFVSEPGGTRALGEQRRWPRDSATHIFERCHDGQTQLVAGRTIAGIQAGVSRSCPQRADRCSRSPPWAKSRPGRLTADGSIQAQ